MITRDKVSHYTLSQSFCFTSKKFPKRSLNFYRSQPFPGTCIAFSLAYGAGNSRVILCQNGRTLVKNKALNKRKENGEVEIEGLNLGEREVFCEVEVISWRERRIKAEISINADVESVWNALTDYERLSDFIPNLVRSVRIPCPYPGRIWLEQRGLQRALYWHIEARVVLDLQEFPNSENDRELHFSMVEGDFKKFEGKWSVKYRKGIPTTILNYEVNVIPRFNFPAIFLERIIRSDLPVNLQAIAVRSESGFKGNQDSVLSRNILDESSLNSLSIESVDSVPVAMKEIGEKNIQSLFSPLSPSDKINTCWGIFRKSSPLDRSCMADEVHLRRFDGLLENGGVHRCVLACITVKAPVCEVWNVLTAYERLPERFICFSLFKSRDSLQFCNQQGFVS